MPLKTVIRKHSAKCMKFQMGDGDVRHFLCVGGRWIYNGRKDLMPGGHVANNIAADGFWTDSIAQRLKDGSAYTFKMMIDSVKTYPGGVVGHQLYMRHWESISQEGVPF